MPVVNSSRLTSRHQRHKLLPELIPKQEERIATNATKKKRTLEIGGGGVDLRMNKISKTLDKLNSQLQRFQEDL